MADLDIYIIFREWLWLELFPREVAEGVLILGDPALEGVILLRHDYLVFRGYPSCYW